jgi:CheY-like chemotaxis protein
MGGRIWVESELGQGATFIFAVDVERCAEKRQSLLAPGMNWKNMRVLVVDDDADLREYFREMAQSLHLACDAAAGGEEAVALIENGAKYDLFFVDWKMPGMDGIELSRYIREHTADKTVVIMISAVEWSVVEEEAKAAGVDRFLSKPLFVSAIADCINECLGVDNNVANDASAGVTDCFAGLHVMLVEDIEINREIVIALLEPTELVITCAENGKEALRLFEADPGRYDMIFMDVHMPEMDGYEATQRIRALAVPDAGRVPIIAMTANVFREDVEKCLAAGMNDHVGKPLDLEEVLIRLRRYLPHHGRK